MDVDMNTSPALKLPEDAELDIDPRPRIQITATQVVASALAAITATVAASYLGIAGTVIGAAVASVLTVIGNAVYSHSIQRTGERVITTVRTAVPAAGRFAPRPIHTAPPARAAAPARARAPDRAGAPTRTAPRRRWRGWPIIAAASVGLFAGVLFVITAVEIVAGRPLSDVVRDKPGSGTSVLGHAVAQTGRTTAPTPTPTVTVTVTPTVVTATPTVTVTGVPVTETATPTTPTPTPTASTPSPTPSPSLGGASATPSAG